MPVPDGDSRRVTPPKTVVVTGAGGFIGSWVCRALGEAGATVRGMGRRAGVRLPHGGSYQQADLLDAGALRAALAGADAVIHLAARVHVMRETAADALAEFRRVNVEGTRILLDASADAGVTRVVLASTVKAVAESSDAPLTERTAPRPADPYGISKLESEQVAQGFAARRGLGVTVLRFPLVYGPGMKGNMLSLFDLVNRGVPLPLGRVRNRRSMLFVGNLSAAVLGTLRTPAAVPGVFFVADGRDVSTPELVRLIGDALGRKVWLLPVPVSVFRAAGWAGDALSRLGQIPLTSAAVDRLLGSLAVDASALAQATGFRPPFSVEQGLRATADWYLDPGGPRA